MHGQRSRRVDKPTEREGWAGTEEREGGEMDSESKEGRREGGREKGREEG